MSVSSLSMINALIPFFARKSGLMFTSFLYLKFGVNFPNVKIFLNNPKEYFIILFTPAVALNFLLSALADNSASSFCHADSGGFPIFPLEWTNPDGTKSIGFREFSVTFWFQ